MTALVTWARDTAETAMATALSRRWSHVQAVARKAEHIRSAVDDDGDLLVAAAWLHDIGYAPVIARTGFHPLDGARYLDSVGASARLCALVANHSGAAAEAELRGLSYQMRAYPDESSTVRDALWMCDMTTSPDGKPVSFADRLAEIRERYGTEHVVARAISASAPEIRSAIRRVDECLADN